MSENAVYTEEKLIDNELTKLVTQLKSYNEKAPNEGEYGGKYDDVFADVANLINSIENVLAGR